MPKVYATISEELANALKIISEETAKSFSKTIGEILQFGIEKYRNQQKNKSHVDANNESSSHEKKLLANSLMTLSVAAEILKKLKNEPSTYDGKTTDFVMTDIKNITKKFLKIA